MAVALYLAAIIAGFALLTWSADRFIEGAVGCSVRFQLPDMITGLLLVGLGTSAPEIVVSAIAAVTGSPGIAVGNALGSNIANIGLVLGITTLVAPLPLQKSVLRRELPILLLVTGLAWLLLMDRSLTPGDGAALLAMLVFSFGYLMWRHGSDPEELDEDAAHAPIGRALIKFTGGLVLLVVSARLLVWGASELALTLGVEDLIVGLTIVAIGTSLPELAATLAAARRGHHEMALGNIVGSNLFNLLAVLAVPAFLSPVALSEATLWRDYGTMAGLTVLLAAFAYSMQRKGKLARMEGGILVAIYGGYTAVLVINAL